MKKQLFLILFLVLLSNSAVVWAQIEPEEIKQDADKFEDNFYEALLQKGIGNNDKAIVSLEQCLKIQPENATVYFELGKNYLELKNHENAYNSFQHATQIDPTNKWFWVGMYDVSYETKNYNQAINTVTKLITFDERYKEDLVSLYMATHQFDKALEGINELNDKYGKSDKRDLYKREILSGGKYQNVEITNLLDQINKNPKEEANYIALIFLYSNTNENEKAFEITTKLEKEIPTSEWAQISLFKNYLDLKDGPNAIKAMHTVLSSSKIDAKIKHRMLNEFLLFVNTNPQYSPDLDKAILYFDTDKDINVAKEVGKFYHNKRQWDSAVKYYEQAGKKNAAGDIETDLLLLQALTETKKFDLVAQKASVMLETFPTQPEFYYYAGLANNQLKQFKESKDFLEIGIDYVVENHSLQINFNVQLGEAYNGLGDFKKKELYFNKANELLKLK